MWLVGGAVLAAASVIAIIAVLLAGGQGRARADQPGGPVGGIQCGAMEGTSEHIHTHIAIFIKGRPRVIPQYVGIPTNQQIAGRYCFYWLHTHATTNVIHIEAPQNGTYTFGQFLDIWRDTARWDAQSTVAGGFHVDPTVADELAAADPSNVRVYVGSKYVGSNMRAIVFSDHEDVTIEVGRPLRPPVANFDWAHWQGL
jgi:hypothetical protein